MNKVKKVLMAMFGLLMFPLLDVYKRQPDQQSDQTEKAENEDEALPRTSLGDRNRKIRSDGR